MTLAEVSALHVSTDVHAFFLQVSATIRRKAFGPGPNGDVQQCHRERGGEGAPGVHLQASLHRTLAWKHSQYFLRHLDLRQRHPFRWPSPFNTCASAALTSSARAETVMKPLHTWQ